MDDQTQGEKGIFSIRKEDLSEINCDQFQLCNCLLAKQLKIRHDHYVKIYFLFIYIMLTYLYIYIIFILFFILYRIFYHTLIIFSILRKPVTLSLNSSNFSLVQFTFKSDH